MFDDLRQAFREALDNFNKELSSDQTSETADKLLIGMRNEIISEKARIVELKRQLLTTTVQIDDLTENIATARRRQGLARDIGDEGTAGLAADWLTKARHQRTILVNKAGALRDEIEFCSQAIDEMHTRFSKAQSKRETLSASSGRTGAYESITGTDEHFDNLNRMADKIKIVEADVQAEGDVHVEGSELPVELNQLPSDQQLDVDAALEELKRRMGET